MSITDLMIYPNPTRDFLHLRSMDQIQGHVKVEIWDMFGQLVLVADFADLRNEAIIGVQELSSAPYLIKLMTTRNQQTQQTVIRFVKQ